jgi:hypothetical protein
MLYKQEDKFFASKSLNSLFSHIVLSSATSKCDMFIPNIPWIRKFSDNIFLGQRSKLSFATCTFTSLTFCAVHVELSVS